MSENLPVAPGGELIRFNGRKGRKRHKSDVSFVVFVPSAELAA